MPTTIETRGSLKVYPAPTGIAALSGLELAVAVRRHLGALPQQPNPDRSLKLMLF